jgi:hypothetical protein
VTGPAQQRVAVKRVDTADLPQVSWDCFEANHAWDLVSSRAATGWGPRVDAEEQLWECGRDGCTRWRRDVIDAATGDRLSRPDYGGGTYVWVGGQPTKAEARKHNVLRRRLARQWEEDQAVEQARAAAREAIAEHRAERAD